MATNTPRTLTDIINNEALAYAIYTVENRAIPNIIDGFKPVQRFMIYRALELSKGNKDKFFKLAAVAGGVADAGYHHGESSAQDAGALLANTWNNNVPFLDGQGNFGSRLVQEAAASRYIFCRISENFRKIFKDFDIAPVHKDLEHLPPMFYLPIIPTVLLNGVSGIATGYSTTILPHSLKSVIECTKLAIKGELDQEPEIEFPEFLGKVIKVEDNKYELHGLYDHISATRMDILEIPYQWDRAKYIEKVLDPLEDSGLISYEDHCSKAGFKFRITFKKDYGIPKNKSEKTALHDKIMKDFKLIQRISQNIVVINEQGKLLDSLQTSKDLINYFVKVRKDYIQKRIEYKIDTVNKDRRVALAKYIFITAVIQGDLVLKDKTRKELKAEITDFNEVLGEFSDLLSSMPMYSMTKDELKKLKDRADELKTELEYWKQTTAETEYLKDLESIV